MIEVTVHPQNMLKLGSTSKDFINTKILAVPTHHLWSNVIILLVRFLEIRLVSRRIYHNLMTTSKNKSARFIPRFTHLLATLFFRSFIWGS